MKNETNDSPTKAKLPYYIHEYEIILKHLENAMKKVDLLTDEWSDDLMEFHELTKIGPEDIEDAIAVAAREATHDDVAHELAHVIETIKNLKEAMQRDDPNAPPF